MSVKVMGAAWELNLTAPKLLVLLALADHADHNGSNVFPSMRLTAWKTGYSERQIQRIIKSLVQDGILVVVDLRPGRTIMYRIDIDKGVKKSPLTKLSHPRQIVTPDTTTSPLPTTSDVTPTYDITMSPESSVEPSSEPSKEKEIEIPATPEAMKLAAADLFNKAVAAHSHPVRTTPYTDAELNEQLRIALAKHGKKTPDASSTT